MMLGVMDSVDPCPTEDALGILLEYLVEPKLPSKSSARSTPSQFDQELVAKQVHAVVLLYNYHYRKQHTDLEFLGFENFCKLAVILRPTLLAHLKLMQLSNDTELDDLEKQLSLTEKKIMEACDISANLDALKNAPSVEGWPISKVAVFLIDSRKENCLLQFGSVTEGVWSVIEKDVELSCSNSLGSADSEHVNKKRRFIRKPLKNETSTDAAGLQQQAFSAVKETTGIDQRDLMILERHVVYSTNKEKAAVCFYIMQCTQPSNNHVFKIPIKDAITSLQGPLFIRSSSRWMHTSVVEYFHLLPYAEILSDWLSGKGLSNSLEIQKVVSETTKVNISKRIEKSCNSEVPESSDGEQQGSKTGSGSTNQNEDVGFDKVCLSKDFDGLHSMEVNDSLLVHAQTEDKGTDFGSKIQPDNYQKIMTSVYGCSNGSMKKARMADSLKRQKITECRDGTVACGDKYCDNISSDQNKMPINDNVLVTYEPTSYGLDKVCKVIASKDQELSKAALRVILSKRAKLCFQLRDIEDQIALCDKNIQTILNGGEGDLAMKIEYLIEGCNDVSLKSLTQATTDQHCNNQCLPQYIQTKRLPANAQNPCQELDILCHRNDWILPTYKVSALDGGYQAKIIVKGTDFEYSSTGNLRSHPREARESAAAQMLTKLQNAPNVVL